MTAAISQDQAQQAFAAVINHGGQRAAARALGVRLMTVQRRLAAAKRYGLGEGKAEVIDVEPVIRGRVHALPRVEWPLPPKGQIARYVFTCAQSNTYLHQATWDNLKAVSSHYGARICVSTFTYDLASYGAQSVKRGKTKGSDGEPWYDEQIYSHILDEAVVVAPGLVWCGEMNILPTAVRPLSGLESYTGRKSGIFPHVKFAMESIASGKFEPTKFNYTTGTITQRNYIEKKAGQKAEFHHGYGALLVEVDSDGNWFCRQLNADSAGTIYDLTLRAKGGKVTDGHRVEAITWGDIHVGTVSPEMEALKWGIGGMLDTLRPRLQFCHDLLDFRSRNHHDQKNHHRLFEKYVEGVDDVLDEITGVIAFTNEKARRGWCKTVVVDSNHDNALKKWLQQSDFRDDPKNAIFYLKAQTALYEAIACGERDFHLLEWAFRYVAGEQHRDVVFLRPDQSYIICPDANGGIECGQHGHNGPNGRRGSIAAFSRMGRKSNLGHAHTAAIVDGAYQAGIVGNTDQGYNTGPSSWSYTDIITYKSGKRSLLTTFNGKWRA